MGCGCGGQAAPSPHRGHGVAGGGVIGFVEGGSADMLQTTRARGRTTSHAINGPASSMRMTPGHNVASADFAALQALPKRPTIGLLVGAGALGVDQLTVHLPGRQPPAGWSGEHDATSPHASFGSVF